MLKRTQATFPSRKALPDTASAKPKQNDHLDGFKPDPMPCQMTYSRHFGLCGEVLLGPTYFDGALMGSERLTIPANQNLLSLPFHLSRRLRRLFPG